MLGLQIPPFDQLDGDGVRVGIVDSGIEAAHPGFHGCVIGGISLLSPHQRPNLSSDSWIDNLGHGTAVASIVHKKAPRAALYAIKIFDEKLAVSVQCLITAIEWGIEQHLDILNLSLGTTHLNFDSRVRKTCREALTANLILVSASHCTGMPSLPASLPEVIGVSAGRIHGRYDYLYVPDQETHWVARGDAQRVVGLNGKDHFSGGTSYAAPHITGIVALVRQAIPGATPDQVIKVLEARALRIDESKERMSDWLVDDTYTNQILLNVRQLELEMAAERQPHETQLERRVKAVVAKTLDLSSATSHELKTHSLLNPKFGLNPLNTIKIIDNLQAEFGFSVPEEELKIDCFYSVRHLAELIRRHCILLDVEA